MRAIFAAVAGLVIMTAPLLAQDASTNELLDRARTAFAAGNAREAARLAEQAVAVSVTPDERFNARMMYGDVLREAGDDRAAYELYSRALEVVEEHDPDNAAALDVAVSRLAATALRLGRRAEWVELSQRSLDLNQVALEPLWRFEDDMQVRHRLSGYPCPLNADGFIRGELLTYNALGTDVSCRYTVSDTPGPTITIHAYRTGFSHQSAYDNSLADMLRNFTGARRQDEGETGIGGVPVRYGIYRQSRIIAGVWTAQLGEWTLKLRITHSGELSREQMDAAARLAFSSAGDVERHLAHCASLGGNGRFLSQQESADPLRAAMTLVASGLTGEESASPPEAMADPLQCFVAEANFRPTGGSVLASISENGDLLDYRAYPRGSTDVYLEASPVRGLSAAVLGLAEGSTLEESANWILRLITPDRTGVYGEFDGTPSPETFRDAVDAILDGTIPVTVWLSQGEDGNLQIQLVGPLPEPAAD